MRSVDDYAHQATRNDTGDREGNDPASIDPENHSPVDRLDITCAKTNTNGGTDNALGGGDGQGETGSQDDGDG